MDSYSLNNYNTSVTSGTTYFQTTPNVRTYAIPPGTQVFTYYDNRGNVVTYNVPPGITQINIPQYNTTAGFYPDENACPQHMGGCDCMKTDLEWLKGRIESMCRQGRLN